MPANTPGGLPYPLPTEPVAEGAAAIRALAEAIEAKGCPTARATSSFFNFAAGDSYNRVYTPPLTQQWNRLGGTPANPFTGGYFVAPVAGIYDIGFQLWNMNSGSALCAIMINDGPHYKQGGTQIYIGSDANKPGLMARALAALNVGGTAKLVAWNTGGTGAQLDIEIVLLSRGLPALLREDERVEEPTPAEFLDELVKLPEAP